MAKRTELLLVILWLFAGVWLVYLATGKPALGIDDAQIFFTYAQNLSGGEGLIYSRGIAPAEGYTSSLWMAICSLMFWVHANETGVLVVSFVLLLATQLLAFRIIDRVCPPPRTLAVKLLYVLLVSVSPAYLSWTTITLMDTGIWSTLVVAMACVLIVPPLTASGWLVAGLPFVLAPLARPEAVAVAPAMLALLWIKLRGQRLGTAPAWWILVAFIASTLALTAFRLAYFGYPLPNTYYAKVSGSTLYNLRIGTGYLAKFVFGSNIALIAALACVPFGWRLLARAVRALRTRSGLALSNGLDDSCQILAAICLLMLVLPVDVGGDHFSLSRFYQPAWPLFCLLLAFAAVRFISSPRRQRAQTAAAGGWRVPVALVCVVALLSLSSYRDSWLNFARHGSPLTDEFMIGVRGERMGDVLDEVFADGRGARPIIGVVAAGGIARTYRGPIVDLMGLNNAYIAHFPGERVGIKDHAAFEKAAFFNMPVDMLLTAPDHDYDEVVLKGLFHDPRFTEQWRYGVVYDKQQPKEKYEGFYSKKFLASLDGGRVLGFYETMVFSRTDGQWERVKMASGQAVRRG